MLVRFILVFRRRAGSSIASRGDTRAAADCSGRRFKGNAGDRQTSAEDEGFRGESGCDCHCQLVVGGCDCQLVVVGPAGAGHYYSYRRPQT